jgi:DNA/RNA endonuclease YhcR with UshA esterase domain
MEKTIIVQHTEQDGTITEHIVIDNGNGSFTSMLKSTYEAMQAEQSTPMVADAD